MLATFIAKNSTLSAFAPDAFWLCSELALLQMQCVTQYPFIAFSAIHSRHRMNG